MIRVRVEGAERTVKAFKELGFKSGDLHEAWSRVGAQIRSDAVSLAPTLTGRLAADIRASKAKTRATVAVGRASVPYAGVQNYGWPGHGIEPKYFLNDALDQNADSASREVFSEMDRLIKSVGLK